MKTSALALTLIFLMVPLAGCSGTDTEVSVDLSNEDINELIDENLEDVMNNTTVVVFQEYNNNTSIVNHNNAYHNDTYQNNTTVVMQPSTTKVMSGTLAGMESIDDMPEIAAVVREDRYNSGSNLNGATICVGIGTALESDFQDWFNDGNIDFTSVPVADQNEATQKLRDGECDALATTGSEAQTISESIDLATWVASPGSHDGPPYSVRNSVTFQIHQASDELISRPFYDFTMIELHLICTEGATNCENVTLTASSYNDVNIDYYLDNENIEVITVCENGIVFSNPHGYFYEHQGTGMNCTHNWNYHIEIPLNTIPEWEFSTYTFEWSEWTYSFAYTSETMEVVSS